MTVFIGLFKAIPTGILHAFALLLGTLTAVTVTHRILVKSTKVLFSRRRDPRL